MSPRRTVKPDKRRVARLKIKQALIDQFKREAKYLFPVECYAIMLGQRTCGSAEVKWLMFPDIMGDYSTEEAVMVQERWWQHAHAVAKAKDMVVLGDIHSHCYEAAAPVKDHAPSEDDWERFGREYFQGICVCTKTKTGGIRSSVKFWESTPDVTMEIC